MHVNYIKFRSVPCETNLYDYARVGRIYDDMERERGEMSGMVRATSGGKKVLSVVEARPAGRRWIHKWWGGECKDGESVSTTGEKEKRINNVHANSSLK